jgi:hypothetical protein
VLSSFSVGGAINGSPNQGGFHLIVFSRKQQKTFLKHRSLLRHAFFVLFALFRLYQLTGSFDSVGVR